MELARNQEQDAAPLNICSSLWSQPWINTAQWGMFPFAEKYFA